MKKLVSVAAAIAGLVIVTEVAVGADLAGYTTPALEPVALGKPGEVGVGPTIDSIAFDGNTRVPTAQLEQVLQLKTGAPLSAAVIYPELARITQLYSSQGGAYVQPQIDEVSLDHARVVFRIHEGVTAREGPERASVPKRFEALFGNTLVCAATQTGNDLCHMWMNRDGTFIIFDPTGVHTGHWVAGKVRADGRIPICRYWDLSDFTLPAELRPAMPAAAPPAPAREQQPQSARLCETRNFRTTCTNYPDVRQLSPKLQRMATLPMLQQRHEEGICYAHGPHELGDVWFEWDDPWPGQLGLDREMLLPGHQ
jgi:hypothetical protein